MPELGIVIPGLLSAAVAFDGVRFSAELAGGLVASRSTCFDGLGDRVGEAGFLCGGRV